MAGPLGVSTLQSRCLELVKSDVTLGGKKAQNCFSVHVCIKVPTFLSCLIT